MPKEIEDAIGEQLAAGKLPDFCKSNGLKGDACKKAYASMVGNLIKKRRQAKGGKDTEAANSFYSQILVDGDAYEDEEAVWVLVAEPDTHLNLSNGSKLPVNELAHVASLGAWVSPLYNNKIHIDHKKDKTVKGEFLDVRYDFDRGLYLKMDIEDAEIKSHILDGTIRPSIEVDAELAEDGSEIGFYLPTGLGLMWEGEAMGLDVGAETPTPEAMEALGGDTMSEDKPKEQEKPLEDTKELPTTDTPPAPEPPKEVEPVAEPPSEEDWQAKYNELVTKLDAKDTKYESYTAELRQTYLSRLPENMREAYKDADVERLKDVVTIAEGVRADFSERLDKTEKSITPIIRERDELAQQKATVDDRGRMDDKAWAIMKAAEYVSTGRTNFPDRVKELLTAKELEDIKNKKMK